VKDPQRYAPAHVAGVRELRDLLRKGTPGAAVVGVQPGQANDQEEAQTPEAAMEAATQEAVKQLKDAQKMVQDLVKNGSTAQHIADALVFLNNAVEYFKKTIRRKMQQGR
jgi:FixJ family two-component response regulator